MHRIHCTNAYKAHKTWAAIILCPADSQKMYFESCIILMPENGLNFFYVQRFDQKNIKIF